MARFARNSSWTITRRDSAGCRTGACSWWRCTAGRSCDSTRTASRCTPTSPRIAAYHANDMVVDGQGRAYVGNFGFDLDGAMQARGVENVLADHPTATLARVDAGRRGSTKPRRTCISQTAPSSLPTGGRWSSRRLSRCASLPSTSGRMGRFPTGGSGQRSDAARRMASASTRTGISGWRTPSPRSACSWLRAAGSSQPSLRRSPALPACSVIRTAERST